MGEVYRADDLTLDQPVALKFLPGGVAADDSRLAQFHNELRVARQVSHKNVCRLYDLGDADGRRFLTMEYVDGEDLASLLRRIGRIPQDKAIELARQLCAGVAAAHERGVLHRDLKPANVMIDGDGNVRITDFGIATAGGDASDRVRRARRSTWRRSSSPASRRRSRATSTRSASILFEIFTGRRAYDAKTLGDLKQLHDTGTVTTPSSIVRDLDPAIERVILRCLDEGSGAAAGVGARRSRPRCPAAIRWRRRSRPARRRRRRCSSRRREARRSASDAVSRRVAFVVVGLADRDCRCWPERRRSPDDRRSTSRRRCWSIARSRSWRRSATPTPIADSAYGFCVAPGATSAGSRAPITSPTAGTR